MIKVSAIMSVFNAEKYLRECLNSLRSQPMKDFEVICADDGSTDGAAAILSEYCAKDSRITVIRQENTGAGVVRNRGFPQAKREYVTFLGSR